MQNQSPTFFTKYKGQNGGYALITALIFFLGASAAVIAGISDAIFRETKIVRNESASKQSYFLAESGAEDVTYRIKTTNPYDSTETYVLGGGSTIVTEGLGASGVREIVSSGDIRNTRRILAINLNSGNAISFPYALQAGLGGIDMEGSSIINGDVYTVGSIRGCGSCQITGAAIAAGTSTSNLDQDNSLPDPPPNSIIFGNTNVTQDMGQSFVVNNNLSLVGLQLYIKKVGNPSNATVRIVNDNGGKPTGSVLASGTLSSALVTTSYGWMNITLTANPILSAGTTYWVLVDANTNASSYYVSAANSTYGSGEAKIGRNSTWNTTSLDAYFKVNIGQNQEGITGETQYNLLRVGSSYSYKASYLDVIGALYCQIGTLNNKACDTSRADPTIEPNPVNNATINAWKNDANVSVFTGNYSIGGSSSVTLGPKKITGNVTVGDSAVLRITGTVWVQGDLTISGSGVVMPDLVKNYVIVVDGTVSLGGSGAILGSPGSHILIVTTSSADPAIRISGSADDTVVAAPNGGLLVEGSGKVNAAAAKHIDMTGSAQVDYDPGVSQLNFDSGSSGGTFQIKSWKETE